MQVRRRHFLWAGFWLLVLLLNLPWLVLWRLGLQKTEPQYRDESVFFLLPVIIITGLGVLVALVVQAVIRKRWGFLAFLFAINIYWGVKWIELAKSSTTEASIYFVNMGVVFWVAITSVAGAIIYWLVGRLVKAIRPKGAGPVSRQ